jgi:hypothetical protein
MNKTEVDALLAFLQSKFPEDYDAVGELFLRESIEASLYTTEDKSPLVANFDIYEIYSGLIDAAVLYVAYLTYRKTNLEEDRQRYLRKTRLTLKKRNVKQELIVEIEESVGKDPR